MHRFKPIFQLLFPLCFFAALFFGTALYTGDIYALPVLIAFCLTALCCFIVYRRNGLDENITSFASEAGNPNIIIMILIFLLAGAFSAISQEIGAVQAVINCCLHYVPSSLLVISIFFVCCFLSLAMGSSMGTVVGLSPIAIGLAHQAQLEPSLVVGAVLGGAMFGDNLSSISDTTIAATRTQNCNMGDKFAQNLIIVSPACIITLLIYGFYSNGPAIAIPSTDFEFLPILPYLIILIGAMLRGNVFLLLTLGLCTSSIYGFMTNHFDVLQWFKILHSGMEAVEDLSILSLIAAGTSGLIRQNGGFELLLSAVGRWVHSKKQAEFVIFGLSATVNGFVANNTIAIVIAGPIVKTIANRFKIAGKRSASLMDIATSSVQGLIPFGAQILAAASLTQLSPLSLSLSNYYCYLIALAGGIAILANYPRSSSSAQ